MSAGTPTRPSISPLATMVARAIGAAAAWRALLELSRCCASQSYGWIFLAILGALAWGAVVLSLTAALLAPQSELRRRPASRVGLALLGLVVGAIGTEALWAMGTAVAEPGVSEGLEVLAVSWAACCAVCVRRRWRQLSAARRQAG